MCGCPQALGGGVACLEGRKAAPISGSLCMQAVVSVGAWLPGSRGIVGGEIVFLRASREEGKGREREAEGRRVCVYMHV